MPFVRLELQFNRRIRTWANIQLNKISNIMIMVLLIIRFRNFVSYLFASFNRRWGVRHNGVFMKYFQNIGITGVIKHAMKRIKAWSDHWHSIIFRWIHSPFVKFSDFVILRFQKYKFQQQFAQIFFFFFKALKQLCDYRSIKKQVSPETQSVITATMHKNKYLRANQRGTQLTSLHRIYDNQIQKILTNLFLLFCSLKKEVCFKI